MVCEGTLVTSQDFIKFCGKFFAFILNALIEISQGFKTFWVYLKALIEKLFQTSNCFLKNFFEEIKYQNIIFLYSKPMLHFQL
jgi:hypothetical protein